MDQIVYASIAAGASLHIGAGQVVLHRISGSVGMGVIMWLCVGGALSLFDRFILADTFRGVMLYSLIGCVIGNLDALLSRHEILLSDNSTGMEDPKIVDDVDTQDQPIINYTAEENAGDKADLVAGAKEEMSANDHLPTVGESPSGTPVESEGEGGDEGGDEGEGDGDDAADESGESTASPTILPIERSPSYFNEGVPVEAPTDTPARTLTDAEHANYE